MLNHSDPRWPLHACDRCALCGDRIEPAMTYVRWETRLFCGVDCAEIYREKYRYLLYAPEPDPHASPSRRKRT